jgi:hypothetical protein
MTDLRNRKSILLLSTALLFFVLAGCAGRSYQYYKAIWFGKLQPGMSQDAVKALLGEPTGVERRQLPDDFREVWIYHIKNLDPRNHLYPKIHLVVFSNGTMIALDPSNPYAPRASTLAPAVQ